MASQARPAGASPWEVESRFAPKEARRALRLERSSTPHNDASLKFADCDIFAVFGSSAHGGWMAKPAGKITLAPQPVKFGSQWHVVGTYPGGQEEHITGFKTEASALDWIANDSAAWLEKRTVR
jgi:hypothetical protein